MTRISEPEGGCGPIRPSTRSRWRALSLILVHVAAGIHILHWYVTGRSITPVEPSEAMQTLGQGLVNAGFVLFALLILSTLVLGRFFCGWGCHIVALQDLCTWILRRLHIRPRPFRSRLLVFVPLLGAIYMFVLPSLVRMVLGEQRTPFQAQFTTYEFWDRFPGWIVAMLTFLVCGFLIVYFLGNKGFCTYGCPYGGIFAPVDRLAPGKIRVTDACEGCGHCTATCTSNVRVHEEVRLYGMVVDSGCMKCMDCITVCPKGALYYGFGAPSVASGKPRGGQPRRTYDFTWKEEIALAVFFLGSVLVLVALYDAIPLLLALGLASISAYVLLTGCRLFYADSLMFSHFRLRTGGRNSTSGSIALVLIGLWAVFLIHSAVVKRLSYQGGRRLIAARALHDAPGGRTDPRAVQALDEARVMLARSERLGLFPVVNLLGNLGSVNSYLGDHRRAEDYYRRAVEIGPGFTHGRYELARYAEARNDQGAAIRELGEIVERDPEYPGAHSQLIDLLLQAGRLDEAVALIDELMRQRPDNVTFRLTHAVVLARTGEMERAMEATRAIVEDHPEEADAHFELSRLFGKERKFEEALESCRRAVQIDADHVEGRLFCARIAMRTGRRDEALRHSEAARRTAPQNAEVLKVWAGVLKEVDELQAMIEREERAAVSDRDARFRLIYLYGAAGRTEDARRLYSEFH